MILQLFPQIKPENNTVMMTSGAKIEEKKPPLPELFTMENPYVGRFLPMNDESEPYTNCVACAVENSKKTFAFNPRQASNMPAVDKVNGWMKSLPQDPDQGKVFFYPAVIASSAHSETNIDMLDKDDLLEMQARKITRLTTELYHDDKEPVKADDPIKELVYEEFNFNYYDEYTDPLAKYAPLSHTDHTESG